MKNFRNVLKPSPYRTGSVLSTTAEAEALLSVLHVRPREIRTTSVAGCCSSKSGLLTGLSLMITSHSERKENNTATFIRHDDWTERMRKEYTGRIIMTIPLKVQEREKEKTSSSAS